MIHKIHNGEHLPSVNGVATNPDGTRNYDATPTPYILVGNSELDTRLLARPVPGLAEPDVPDAAGPGLHAR